MTEPATIRTGLAVAMLVGLLTWETAHPFFDQFAGGRAGLKKRGSHGAINLAIGLANSLMIAFVFVAAWVASVTWAETYGVGFLNRFSIPFWPGLIIAIVLLDLWTYTWHWLNHTIPFLWRFHRLHHSDKAMDVTTANRFHIVEIFLSSVLRVPVLVLIGCNMEQLAIYETLFFACVQFHHANIAVSERTDRALRAFIVTPFIHKVHHSVKMREANSNYGSLFTWWDRLFRTLKLSRDPQAIVFGVDDDTQKR